MNIHFHSPQLLTHQRLALTLLQYKLDSLGKCLHSPTLSCRVWMVSPLYKNNSMPTKEKYQLVFICTVCYSVKVLLQKTHIKWFHHKNNVKTSCHIHPPFFPMDNFASFLVLKVSLIHIQMAFQIYLWLFFDIPLFDIPFNFLIYHLLFFDIPFNLTAWLTLHFFIWHSSNKHNIICYILKSVAGHLDA